jgi:hypothetical protein
MAGFADAFDTSTGGGSYAKLSEFVGSVVMVVPVDWLVDHPSNFPNEKKNGAMLCDIAVVDVVTIVPASDDVPKEAHSMHLYGAQPIGVMRRACEGARAGRDVKPVLKIVDQLPSKADRSKMITGLVDVDADRAELQALVPNRRNMTLVQLDDAVADLIGKIQEKAYQEWLDYSASKTATRQESARQMFEVDPDQPQRFEVRPQVTDDPWSSLPGTGEAPF